MTYIYFVPESVTKREPLTPETSVENHQSANKMTCCQWTLKKFRDGNKSLISSVKYVVRVMFLQDCLFATFSANLSSDLPKFEIDEDFG